MKKCCKCKKLLSNNLFSKKTKAKDGLHSACKNCASEYYKDWMKKNPGRRKEYFKNWVKNNLKYNEKWKKENTNYYKEYLKNWRKNNPEYAKNWRKNNPEYVKEWRANWRKNNPEYNKEYLMAWKEKNKKHWKQYAKKYGKQYQQKRIKKDPRFRLNKNMRTAIWFALKGKKNRRSWNKLVNYTLNDLTKHLELQFDDKMTWKNYGSYWHVDHIIPISWFIYETPEDIGFKMCWDLYNLQPLEAKANIKKGNNIV